MVSMRGPGVAAGLALNLGGSDNGDVVVKRGLQKSPIGVLSGVEFEFLHPDFGGDKPGVEVTQPFGAL